MEDPIHIPDERHATRCICCLGEKLRSFPAVLAPFVAKRIFNHEPVEITEAWGLRDIQKGMAYSMCNTLECSDCGVLFLDYRFSDPELKRLYEDYRGEEYNRLRTRFEPGYSVTASHYTGRAKYVECVERVLSAYVPDRPNVLDWGGDSGINSPFRYTAGRLHVYDISGVAVCEEASAVSLSECALHEYDLITCSQVLEHVSHPTALLLQVVKFMHRQTILYLEVPFEEIFRNQGKSFPRGEGKRHWHEHINFFSPESMEALARSCGLKVLEARPLAVSLGWKESMIQMLVCKLA
jgi:hypothetical protein